MILEVISNDPSHENDALLKNICEKRISNRLPRLEKTVNVYTEGTNRNVHVYTSITH